MEILFAILGIVVFFGVWVIFDTRKNSIPSILIPPPPPKEYRIMVNGYGVYRIQKRFDEWWMYLPGEYSSLAAAKVGIDEWKIHETKKDYHPVE